MVTLSLAAVVERVVLDRRYFGWLLPRDGESIERPILFGRFDATGDRAFYFVCLVVLVLAITSAKRLRSSRSGRVFISQRDNVRAAQALGVSATGAKLSAFALSGAIAAVAGALYGYQVGAISPTTFPLQRSVDVFVFAIVGGIASPYGAVVGSVVYQTLTYFGTSVFGFLRYFGLGPLVEVADRVALAVGVLIVLALFPGGLAATGSALRDRYLLLVARRRGLLAETGLAVSLVSQGEAPAAVAAVEPDVPTDDAVLVCRGVDVGYDGVQVLFGVDMHVRRGEVLALLGTNGAGKSTLLRAISGLSRASAGSIVLDGVDITTLSPADRVARGIVQVPGGKAVFPTVTVADHFRAARWTMKSEAERARADAAQEQVLEWFPRLRERWDGLAGNLSGGEAQQLAVGMAFVAEPELLIIDELSLGLAPVVVEQLLEVVRLVSAKGTSIILVEQSVNVALTVADRAYFMEKGEVRYSGPTAQLLERGDILRSVFLEGAAPEPASRATAKPVAPEPAPEQPVRAAGRVLEVHDLSVAFGGVRAVDGVSFALDQGEVLGLIGPNGAGKTTVFDLVSGFLVPSAGTVTYQGQDVTALGPSARGMLGLGRSFQDARIFSSMTVAENIAVSLERHLEVRDHLAAALCLPDTTDLERHIAWTVSDLLDLLNLGPYRDSFVRELSTGTRRVVDLAMCFGYEPEVLLLDEPSSGISQKEAESLGPLLLRIRDETGCGILVIEHDMPLITSISDRLLALELGAVVAQGAPQEVISDPRVIASYLGSDEATINRSGAVAVGAAS